ncbi:MAG: ISL3 family transposase [Streptosporangiaceae bacterium]
MQATARPGVAQAAPSCADGCGAATLLLGLPGFTVTAVAQAGDGRTAVDVVTSPDLADHARTCPGCGTLATTVKDTVTTTPRDVWIGDRQVRLRWRKRRWKCGGPGCDRETFTESLPQVPPRARLTARLRTRLGVAVGDDLMPAAAAARRYGVSDRTAARAFAGYADAQLADLDNDPGLGSDAAGIDEFRRGIPAYGTDPETGEPVKTRSEWLTHVVDLDTGGTLGLAEGRTGAVGQELLASHAGRLRYLAMDLSAPYRSGAPAGVRVIADAFHLVQLANRKIDAAFRRLSYRTEHPHEEVGLPRPLHYMLRYNIETLTAGQLAIIIDTLDGDADGQQIAAVWIAKEHLRALLALRATRTHVTPAPSAVRDKLASFYLWCADHDHIPELKTLASVIEKWQQPVIDAVLSGYSNAKAEAHNRTAKLVARNARGFASPGNQKRRVRMATTRTARQDRHRTRPQNRSRTVARSP